jgi:tetratricopeptide (TPR) repeat protein
MPARFSRLELAWIPLVLLALLAVYLPGLDNTLVFDDSYLAEGLFADYRSLAEWRARLLSYGSFVWLQALWGEEWWKQRLFNLALHVGVVAALWALYREILRALEPAQSHRSPALGIAIGFFALNPVAVYAVAYLIQRSILMATLFVVMALWLVARGLRLGKPLLHVAALGAYVLALLSKEHAILAPLAAVPLYIVIARPPGKRLALLSAAGALVVAAAGAALWYRYGEIIGKPFDEFSRIYLQQLAQLDPAAPARAYPLSIVNQAYLFFEYGARWMVPFSGWMSINLRPPFPVSLASFPQVLGPLAYLAVVVGGFFLVIRFRDWRALAGLALLFPALLFATEFATVWVQDPFVLYRSYLWAIGIPGLVFCLVHDAPPRAALAIGVVLAGLLAWQALDRVLSLATPEHAWTDAIAKLSGDPRAVGRWFPYLNRGTAYVEHEEYALALRDFESASSLGDMGMGALNTGAILATEGKHAQALAAFDRAEKQGYNAYNLPFQRGLSLLATGKPEEAYRQLEAARAMSPPSPTRELLLLNLGRTALQLGRADAAIRDLEPLLAADPRHKEARYLLGMAYVTREDHARAEEVLSRLLAEDASGPAFYARARANHGLKRKAQALADIGEALARDPRNPHLLEWQARIRAMPGAP